MPIDLKDAVIGLAAKASDVEEALNQQILKVNGLEARDTSSRSTARTWPS